MPRQITAVRISTIAGGDQVVAARRTPKPGCVMPACFITSAKYVDQPDRHRAGPQRQLQDQVPADDPGDELAEAGVGERVRRARHRHRAGELGVAERRQRAGDPGEHERERDGRTGLLAGGLAGEHEDAGADDHADPEHRQLSGAELACGAGARAPRCRRSTARWSSCGTRSSQSSCAGTVVATIMFPAIRTLTPACAGMPSRVREYRTSCVPEFSRSSLPPPSSPPLCPPTPARLNGADHRPGRRRQRD